MQNWVPIRKDRRFQTAFLWMGSCTSWATAIEMTNGLLSPLQTLCDLFYWSNIVPSSANTLLWHFPSMLRTSNHDWLTPSGVLQPQPLHNLLHFKLYSKREVPLIFNPAGSVFILCCKIHKQYGLLHLQASPYGSPSYLSCSISHATYQCQIASGIAEGTKEKLVHPSHKAQKHKASRGSQTHRVLSY